MVYIKKADREKDKTEEVETPSASTLNAVKLKLEYKPFEVFSVPNAVKEKYPESQYHLLWARNDTKRTSMLESIGYDYCTIDPVTRRKDRLDDGYVRDGDSILMYCAKELYESRQKHFRAISDSLKPKTNEVNATNRRDLKATDGVVSVEERFKQGSGIDTN